ncbi:hypothetical protein HBI25_015550 [Parastagonospora nodorum]|nr:hypothetical protein HBH53_019180 [Parastagonospora nodorum]KAH3977373.1 hypothetical protein HBH52_113590 [Parastagonospora nodorum]KAH4000015.1 hypothetical protein HBI10_108170 [Parastagonospora nodorum]KAH4022314.1 hypothetical protein HBI13_101020 [Parastagonospora nodorum]KAH4027679.1 hypothetical protein HBI09_141800 [Parastagonospora nodorum]
MKPMTHTERPERRIPSAPLSLSSQKSPLRETTVTVSPRDVSETANEPVANVRTRLIPSSTTCPANSHSASPPPLSPPGRVHAAHAYTV